jgi:hypothetical protein
MPAAITRLTGVYDADGSIPGELRYLIGRELGSRHCALCDITHGRLREKPAWQAARRRLAVPFRAIHRDERTPAERAASEGRMPCVLAHTNAGIEVLLDHDALERCGGDPKALVTAIERALAGSSAVLAEPPAVAP